MHKKLNSIKLGNIIQGLRPISNTLPKNLKKKLIKRGYNFSTIVDNWGKIVGKKISDICFPSKIINGKEGCNSTLILNVIHGKQIEVEYSKTNIIDKINGFFGYSFLAKIVLKTIEINKVKKYKASLNKNLDFENKLKKIKNTKLRIQLKDLIAAYNEKKT